MGSYSFVEAFFKFVDRDFFQRMELNNIGLVVNSLTRSPNIGIWRSKVDDYLLEM